MKKQIRAYVKYPGTAPVLRDIENTLDSLQSIVGGYIETVTFGDVVVVCNEEGRFEGLTPNCSVISPYGMPVSFVGTIVFLGTEGDEFANCPKAPECYGKELSRVYL